jgi:hypothetical protein
VATDSSVEPPADHEHVRYALKRLSEADEELAAARAASENAPPDPDFPHRVRVLAHGFMRQGEALSRAANTDGITWIPAPRPARQRPISHELRPGGNRPGPPHLWEAFDRAVDEVAEAARKLIASLHSAAPPRDRDAEARKARERSRLRFG